MSHVRMRPLHNPYVICNYRMVESMLSSCCSLYTCTSSVLSLLINFSLFMFPWLYLINPCFIHYRHCVCLVLKSFQRKTSRIHHLFRHLRASNHSSGNLLKILEKEIGYTLAPSQDIQGINRSDVFDMAMQ